MVLIPVPFASPCLLARLVALKGTITILLVMLIKSRLQIKIFSTIGILLSLMQTLVFLAGAGGVGLALVGAAILKTRNRASA